MWANKNFMILVAAYGLIYGVYCGVGGTMSNLLNPFGYSPSEISIAGGCCLLSGVIGALCIGCFLDRTALYRKTTIMITLFSTVAVIMLAVLLGLG